MSKWLIIVLSCVLSREVAAQAKGELSGTSPEVAARVEALVRELGDENWLTRQKAQDELLMLGGEARPRIEQLRREAQDPEVRTRIDALLEQMEEMRLVGVSIVTIRARDAHPRDVLNELARQAHVTIRTSPANLWASKDWPRVTLAVDRQPFWAVFPDVCARAGVAPQSSVGTDRQITVAVEDPSARALAARKSVTGGPFLLTMNNLTFTRSLELNAQQNIRRDVRMQFTAYPEPKMRVLQGSSSARLTEVVDENGKSMLGGGGLGTDYLTTRADWAWTLSAVFQPPVECGKVIKKLKGSARFVVQARSEQIEIDKVMDAKNQSRQLAGRRITLKEVKQNGALYTATITLHTAGVAGAEWTYQGPNQQNVFRLVDKEGQAFMRQVTNPTVARTAETMDITVQFRADEGQEPAKLVWEVPVEMREIVVPFEFNDIPLP